MFNISKTIVFTSVLFAIPLMAEATENSIEITNKCTNAGKTFSLDVVRASNPYTVAQSEGKEDKNTAKSKCPLDHVPRQGLLKINEKQTFNNLNSRADGCLYFIASYRLWKGNHLIPVGSKVELVNYKRTQCEVKVVGTL
jgi:hypothetical protein